MSDQQNNSTHPLYYNWSLMQVISRSKNIHICDRWHIFEHYVEDIEKLPKLSTDTYLRRIDLNIGFKPGNVTWGPEPIVKLVKSKSSEKAERSSKITAEIDEDLLELLKELPKLMIRERDITDRIIGQLEQLTTRVSTLEAVVIRLEGCVIK